MGYRCESPEWRSGGADLGAFNMPTVATTSTCVKAGWIHLSRLFAIPLLRRGSRPHPSAEDLETTSPPTATAVPVVPTWTPTLAPTPEIAANSAIILALAVAETPPDVPDYGRNHWGRRIDEDGD